MPKITQHTLPPTIVQRATDIQPVVLRPSQAAAYLNISRSFFYLLVKQKELALLSLGGRASGVMRSDLDAWLMKQRDAAAAA